LNKSSQSEAERASHQIVCLLNISKHLSDTQRDTKEVFNTLVHLLPEGWQYPTDACARIVLDNLNVQSVNFQETEWRQNATIQSGERNRGFIEVCYLNKKPKSESGPFLVDEVNLLNIVAAEVGVYLERKQVENLKNQQHKELELYSSLLRHDLRNDVSVIIGNLEIAKLTIPNRNDDLNQMISSTEAVCERMMNLLSIFGKAAKAVDADPVKMIQRIVEQAKSENPSMQVTLKVNDEMGDMRIPESKLFPLVFDNLLRNAITHAGPSPKIEIEISLRESTLSFIFADDGPGIDSSVRERLFQKGASTRGGGLGLYLSKSVVETMGGTMQLLESLPGMGATFQILLPIIR
jgi:signal transduction histidine kinase